MFFHILTSIINIYSCLFIIPLEWFKISKWRKNFSNESFHCGQRPPTKQLSIGRHITVRFCWNYDVVNFSFSKIHPLGNRQLPVTHIWLVMLQMKRPNGYSVSVIWLQTKIPNPAFIRDLDPFPDPAPTLTRDWI